MSTSALIPESKLPALGTTIFTQMSALAAQHQAINLSQGFPDFDGPDYLKERLAWHVSQGANQYAPMTGVAPLREAIAEKTAALYGWLPDATNEVTVTAGATEALFAAISALVRPGDEVICFDPSYDSYAPAVTLSGGTLKRITLQPPAFSVDWSQFGKLLSPRTRLVILNTPHNPSATAWQAEDMQQLWHAIGDHEIYVLSDEVYEHICFAKGGHTSVLAHPQLRQRAIAVSSFGKTFHMTGWKVGYCVAPAALSAEVRKVHQYLTFSVNGQHPGPVGAGGHAAQRAGTLAAIVGILSRQARSFCAGAVQQSTGNFALRGYILLTGRLQRRFQFGRRGILPLVNRARWRGGDPAVGLLCRSFPS